jgi:hypothetical protein
MATESVATRFVIDEAHLSAIKVMLLQSIKADHELERVRRNLAEAGAAKMTAAQFNSVMRPNSADIDAGEVAEMVMILDMMEAAQ